MSAASFLYMLFILTAVWGGFLLCLWFNFRKG